MKSFLSGKKTVAEPSLVSVAPVVAMSSTPPLRPHAVTGKATLAPNVEVVKEGNKVVRLVITCACGERMEVECLYPAGV